MPTGNPEWNSRSFPWFFPDEKMHSAAFMRTQSVRVPQLGVWHCKPPPPPDIYFCKWDFSKWFCGILRLSNLTFIRLFLMWNFWEKKLFNKFLELFIMNPSTYSMNPSTYSNGRSTPSWFQGKRIFKYMYIKLLNILQYLRLLERLEIQHPRNHQ